MLLNRIRRKTLSKKISSEIKTIEICILVEFCYIIFMNWLDFKQTLCCCKQFFKTIPLERYQIAWTDKYLRNAFNCHTGNLRSLEKLRFLGFFSYINKLEDLSHWNDRKNIFHWIMVILTINGFHLDQTKWYALER